jgi:hypothetical protein
MASPADFYVQPGNDLSQSLSGLSGTLGQMREEKARQAERQRLIDAEAEKEKRIQDRFLAAKTAAQAALQSGDPGKMAEVTLEFPEIGQGLSRAFGIVDAEKKAKASSFTRELVTNPQQADQIYQSRIEDIKARNGDPTDTIRSYQAFQQNPQGELKNLQFMWAAMDKDSYGAFSDERKMQQKALAEEAKIAREDARFAQSEAGKNSRAAMNAADRAITRDIALLTAKQNAEMNDLKRQELGVKIAEKQNKLEQSKIEFQKGIDSGVAKIDSSIEAADKLINHPGFSSAVGLSSALPTRPGSDAADFEAELESFNAKTFLTNVAQMKGLGALTEAEGAKLTSAAGAIRKDMSEEALRKNLLTMKEGMEKAKARMAGRSSVESAPAASGPAVGSVSDGYRFLGGDPADPASWEAQ